MKKLLKAFSSLSPDRALINGVLDNDLATVKRAFARGADADALYIYDEKPLGCFSVSTQELKTPVLCLALDRSRPEILAEILSHKPDLMQARDDYAGFSQGALVYALGKLDESPGKVGQIVSAATYKSLTGNQWHEVFKQAFARPDNAAVNLLLSNPDSALIRNEMKAWKKNLDDSGYVGPLTRGFDEAMARQLKTRRAPAP